MRNRERVLKSLEKVYREAFTAADTASNSEQMATLEREYQRDQLQLEVLLDIRELLMPAEADKTTKPSRFWKRLRAFANSRSCADVCA